MTCAECKWWQRQGSGPNYGLCLNIRVLPIVWVDPVFWQGTSAPPIIFEQNFGCIFAEAKETE